MSINLSFKEYLENNSQNYDSKVMFNLVNFNLELILTALIEGSDLSVNFITDIDTTAYEQDPLIKSKYIEENFRQFSKKSTNTSTGLELKIYSDKLHSEVDWDVLHKNEKSFYLNFISLTVPDTATENWLARIKINIKEFENSLNLKIDPGSLFEVNSGVLRFLKENSISLPEDTFNVDALTIYKLILNLSNELSEELVFISDRAWISADKPDDGFITNSEQSTPTLYKNKVLLVNEENYLEVHSLRKFLLDSLLKNEKILFVSSNKYDQDYIFLKNLFKLNYVVNIFEPVEFTILSSSITNTDSKHYLIKDYLRSITDSSWNKLNLSLIDIQDKIRNLDLRSVDSALNVFDASWTAETENLESLKEDLNSYYSLCEKTGFLSKKNPLCAFSFESITPEKSLSLLSTLEKYEGIFKKLNMLGRNFQGLNLPVNIDSELTVALTKLKSIKEKINEATLSPIYSFYVDSGLDFTNLIQQIDDTHIADSKIKTTKKYIEAVFRDEGSISAIDFKKYENLLNIEEYVTDGDNFTEIIDSLLVLKKIINHLGSNQLSKKINSLLSNNFLSINDICGLSELSHLFSDKSPDLAYYSDELTSLKNQKLIMELYEDSTELEDLFKSSALYLNSEIVTKEDLTKLCFELTTQKSFMSKFFSGARAKAEKLHKLLLKPNQVNVSFSNEEIEDNLLKLLRIYEKFQLFESKFKSSALSSYYEGLQTPMAELVEWVDWLQALKDLELKNKINIFNKDSIKDTIMYWYMHYLDFVDIVDHCKKINMLSKKIGLNTSSISLQKLFELDSAFSDAINFLRDNNEHIRSYATLFEILNAIKKSDLLNYSVSESYVEKNQNILELLQKLKNEVPGLSVDSIKEDLQILQQMSELPELFASKLIEDTSKLTVYIKYLELIIQAVALNEELCEGLTLLDVGFNRKYWPSKQENVSSLDFSNYLENWLSQILKRNKYWAYWSEMRKKRLNFKSNGFDTFFKIFEKEHISVSASDMLTKFEYYFLKSLTKYGYQIHPTLEAVDDKALELSVHSLIEEEGLFTPSHILRIEQLLRKYLLDSDCVELQGMLKLCSTNKLNPLSFNEYKELFKKSNYSLFCMDSDMLYSQDMAAVNDIFDKIVVIQDGKSNRLLDKLSIFNELIIIQTMDHIPSHLSTKAEKIGVFKPLAVVKDIELSDKLEEIDINTKLIFSLQK